MKGAAQDDYYRNQHQQQLALMYSNEHNMCNIKADICPPLCQITQSTLNHLQRFLTLLIVTIVIFISLKHHHPLESLSTDCGLA